jgi:hypothetical protein
MSVTRRAQVVLGALVAVVIALTWSWAAQAQTTTSGQTTSTTGASTSTTRAATTTSRVSSTTTTTRRSPNRLTFTASPSIGSPGTNITVASVNPCTSTGNLYVLLSIGQFRLGSGAPDSSGHWRFTVVVPQLNVGTYGLTATCLVARNGVDENAGIYVGPEFTVTQGSGGPQPPTTPDTHSSSSSNTALVIGLIVAIVVSLAAVGYAIYQHNKHRKQLAAAGVGRAPSGPGPSSRPPGTGPPDTFA